MITLSGETNESILKQIPLLEIQKFAVAGIQKQKRKPIVPCPLCLRLYGVKKIADCDHYDPGTICYVE